MKDKASFFQKVDLIEWALYSYFFIIPIIYVIQVITKNQYLSLLPSFFLLVPLIQVFTKKVNPSSNSVKKKKFDTIDYFMIFFFVLTVLWLPVELALYGVKSATSMTIRYIVPFLIYVYVSRYCSERALFWLLYIISAMSFCVAVELLFENVCVRLYQYVPEFQYKSFEYVRDIVKGGELQQFISYKGRPTGILEHLHATVFYIAIGSLASMVVYFYKGWLIPLLFALFDFFVVFISGARVPFFLLVIGFIPFILIVRKDATLSRRFYIFVIISSLAFICGCVLLLSQWHIVHFYVEKLYFLLFLKGQHAQGSYIINDYSIHTQLILQNFQKNLWVLIAGVGPTTLITKYHLGSEDFFLLRVFGQYGLIGGVLFYVLFFIAIQKCSKNYVNLTTTQKLLAIFSIIVLMMFLLSTLHSPAMLRKAIYPFYFLALGIVRFFVLNATTNLNVKKQD